MTKTARVYGGSLYDLAAEEKLDGQIMEQMIAVRQIFRENPGYLKLLGEPAIPEDERLKMIEEAFGGQAERYLVNFLKLLHLILKLQYLLNLLNDPFQTHLEL